MKANDNQLLADIESEPSAAVKEILAAKTPELPDMPHFDAGIPTG